MNISVLGLGIIGTVWARNLIDDGHSVRCWNRTPREFPNFTPSIRDAAVHAEVIFICESLSLSRRAGISDDIYFSAPARNVAHSGLADLKEPKLRESDYRPQFSLKHMAKDLRLALESAREFSLPLDQTAHLSTLYERGLAAGWSDDDFIGLMRLAEQSGQLP